MVDLDHSLREFCQSAVEIEGAGEMTQLPREFASLSEDPALVSRAQIWWLTIAWNSSSRGGNADSRSLVWGTDVGSRHSGSFYAGS